MKIELGSVLFPQQKVNIELIPESKDYNLCSRIITNPNIVRLATNLLVLREKENTSQIKFSPRHPEEYLISQISNKAIQKETQARINQINLINSYLLEFVNHLGINFGGNSDIIYYGSVANHLCRNGSDIDIILNLEISHDNNLTQNDFLGDTQEVK